MQFTLKLLNRYLLLLYLQMTPHEFERFSAAIFRKYVELYVSLVDVSNCNSADWTLGHSVGH